MNFNWKNDLIKEIDYYIENLKKFDKFVLENNDCLHSAFNKASLKKKKDVEKVKNMYSLLSLKKYGGEFQNKFLKELYAKYVFSEEFYNLFPLMDEKAISLFINLIINYNNCYFLNINNNYKYLLILSILLGISFYDHYTYKNEDYAEFYKIFIKNEMLCEELTTNIYIYSSIIENTYCKTHIKSRKLYNSLDFTFGRRNNQYFILNKNHLITLNNVKSNIKDGELENKFSRYASFITIKNEILLEIKDFLNKNDYKSVFDFAIFYIKYKYEIDITNIVNDFKNKYELTNDQILVADNKYFAKRRENILQEKYDEVLEEQRIQKMEEQRRREKQECEERDRREREEAENRSRADREENERRQREYMERNKKEQAERAGSDWASYNCGRCANYYHCSFKNNLTGPCSAFTKK